MAPRGPSLDTPLVLVTKLLRPRSNTKILDIALARGIRTKNKKAVLNHVTHRLDAPVNTLIIIYLKQFITVKKSTKLYSPISVVGLEKQS